MDGHGSMIYLSWDVSNLRLTTSSAQFCQGAKLPSGAIDSYLSSLSRPTQPPEPKTGEKSRCPKVVSTGEQCHLGIVSKRVKKSKFVFSNDQKAGGDDLQLLEDRHQRNTYVK